FAIPANIVVIRAALSGCDIDQVNRSAKSSALKFSAQTYGSTVLATINGRFIQRSLRHRIGLKDTQMKKTNPGVGLIKPKSLWRDNG
ncbi:hypothetical protein PSYMO_16073, partial [Pseudomonas amygdali pv. mori str. 301020]